MPDNTKTHAFCVFQQENEWTLLNRTVYMYVAYKFTSLLVHKLFKEAFSTDKARTIHRAAKHARTERSGGHVSRSLQEVRRRVQVTGCRRLLPAPGRLQNILYLICCKISSFIFTFHSSSFQLDCNNLLLSSLISCA